MADCIGTGCKRDALQAENDRLRAERCKTCKHWTPENPDEPNTLRGAGECQKTPQMWDVTDRVENGDGWSEHKVLKPEHAAVLAIVEDGSAYAARLVTMPDFGCVQHESA